VQIRIRHESQAPENAQVLDDFPFLNGDDIHAVIRWLESWGVRVLGEPIPRTEGLTGEFVVTDDAAYFEVLVHD
jgi:hypothetical protein